ncbi:MAG: DUF4011 domain-containing protein [Firmicutes bacterium]|nr:DUF4011 domain-containing protein [Bacillota bacterium]
MNGVSRPVSGDQLQSFERVDPDRKVVIDKARDGWIRRLIDLSRRNILIYYRDLKTGTVDFSNADSTAMSALLAGKSVQITKLLPNEDENKMRAKIHEIRRRALSNLEEKGLETLFLVFGMATWDTMDGGRPPESPVLMVPIVIESHGREGGYFSLRLVGEPQINPVLLHVLETEYGCKMDAESLLGEGEEDLAHLINGKTQADSAASSVTSQNGHSGSQQQTTMAKHPAEPLAPPNGNPKELDKPTHVKKFEEGQIVYDKHGVPLIITSTKDSGLLWVRFPNGLVSWIERNQVSTEPPEHRDVGAFVRYPNGIELWVEDEGLTEIDSAEGISSPRGAKKFSDENREEDAHEVVTPKEIEETVDPFPIFDRLGMAAQDVKGFKIKRRIVLGNFSFQKMAMVKDLQKYGMEMAMHDIIAAIAGDPNACSEIEAGQHDVDPGVFDQVPPENEFLVLDADSSQQRVISAALGGQNVAVQGPPGTGKSQTIVNLITALVAQGALVLFVAEKRAALDVVLRRLKSVGLGHIALDLHGADISRRSVVQQLSDSLDFVRRSTPVNCAELHTRLLDRRKRLNEHVKRIHLQRPPSGMSAYELQGRLLRLPQEAKTNVRWRGEKLKQLTAENASRVLDLLVEAGGFGRLLFGSDPSPWNGAKLKDGLEVEQATELALRLADELFPAFYSSLMRLIVDTGLPEPPSLQEAQKHFELAGD